MPGPFSIADGSLSPARQISSPNFDHRPIDSNIEIVVIHCISLPPGEYGGDAIERFFTNQLDIDEHPYFREIANLEVSSHLLIKRDADVIQFVNFEERAWHAGVSCYEGRERCNDFSIGIELEGCDDSAFTAQQYHALACVTATLLDYYPHLGEDKIVGHEDIAPGRKKDPGPGFDWQQYRRLLSAELAK